MKHSTLDTFAGFWHGSKLLYMSAAPVASAPDFRSDSSLAISRATASGLLLRYTWSYETKPQSGVLLLVWSLEQQSARAAWTDSWHSNAQLMDLNGSLANTADSVAANLLGHYAAGDDTWGWRIRLQLAADTALLEMHNVTPQGFESLAVHIDYTREEKISNL